jgi:hypothetical protein
MYAKSDYGENRHLGQPMIAAEPLTPWEHFKSHEFCSSSELRSISEGVFPYKSEEGGP